MVVYAEWVPVVDCLTYLYTESCGMTGYADVHGLQSIRGAEEIHHGT